MRPGPLRRLIRLAVRAVGGPVCGLGATLLRPSGRKVGVVLIYHGIAPPRPSGDELVPPHAPELFTRHVHHLRRWYRIVDASDLPEAVASRRRGRRFPVAITFDDDLPQHVRTALPVLRSAGACATFFLCGSSLDRPLAFWWQRLQRAVDAGGDEVPELVSRRAAEPVATGATIGELGLAIELMSPEDRDAVAAELGLLAGPDPPDAGLRAADVRALIEAGMTIGFHTLRHDSLTLLDDDRLAEAMRSGRERLEEAAGRQLDSIAYPHGRSDHRVADAARSAGFRVGFACEGRPVWPDADPLLVPRIEPSFRSGGHFALQLLLALLARPQR